jgi:hypothetical protein
MREAKIIINDEVNIKIQGLELDTRRALMKKFEFEKPGARYLPSVRLGRWNGKISYFSLAGSTFLNLLDQIIPYLMEHDYDIEIDDRRQHHPELKFDVVNEDTFADTLWPKGHEREGQPVVLRDYQVEIVNNFLANPQSLQEVATGAGKTLMTAALAKSVEQYGRSLVIVPNTSLIVQTEADFINLGLDVGVYFGARKEYGKTHTICTWQSLNILLKKVSGEEDRDPEMEEFFFDDIACVIVDECFDGESKVLTTHGYVPIKNIKAGDKVINYCEQTATFKEDTVIKQHRNLTVSSIEKMYEMEFDNGSVIKVTGNHKFLTNLGWCRADELTENHEIVNKS